jgi:Flp pilus assembly protein TadD
VAFYTGDNKTAIAELQKADQHDPLILALLGEAYEKTGDAATAKTYYHKVLDANMHNPNNAFARPLAQKKLGGGRA